MARMRCIFLLIMMMVACGRSDAPPPRPLCNLKIDYGTCLDRLQVDVPVDCEPTITKIDPPVPCDQLFLGKQ